MPVNPRRPAPALLLALALAAFAPASAEAAFVTAVDVSVRPAEGSPWSKGTLFQGQGFQVGHTTGNGWAYGRAKGEAERCGWVLISELNSTTRTDTMCGNPNTEPLGDSEHVPGGGPSERWYVICASATLHGNYGGGPGQLRSPAGMVGKGAPLGWRYTTGDNYAASVDGPTGTPRFILRSCISRTPPMGPPAPGPGPAPLPAGPRIGPPPYRVFDEERAFGRQGSASRNGGSVVARGARRVTVKRTRVTIRLAPGNIVIANGLRGDSFTSSGRYCGQWRFGTITRKTGAKHSGWVQKGAFRGTPKASVDVCKRKDLVDFRSRIGFVNAPFRTIAFRPNKKITLRKKRKSFRRKGVWTVTGSASQVHLKLKNFDPRAKRALDKASLADGCEIYMNRQPGQAPTDPISATYRSGKTIADLVFKGGNFGAAKGVIGYRYTTTDGQYALIAIESGYRKRGKAINVWAFVRRACVEPLSVRPVRREMDRSKVNVVYHPEIRICRRKGHLPTKSTIELNWLNTFAKRLTAVGECRMANGARKRPPGGLPPDSEEHGWKLGELP